jgi:DNA-binding response OmpR family regulator
MDGRTVALRGHFSIVSRDSQDQGHILIVEDDEILAAAMTTAIRSHGYEVKAVGGGGAAIDALALEQPDLLLIDENLPDGEGWRVAQAATREAFGGPPIIVISTNRISRSEQQNRGVFRYVLKPFDVADLLAAVDEALDPGGEP